MCEPIDCAPTRSSSESIQQPAEYLIGITEQSQIGQSKNGRSSVRINSNNGLSFTHTTCMLRRARDTAGDVEFGLDTFSGCADLADMLNPASISCDTGCAYSCS